MVFCIYDYLSVELCFSKENDFDYYYDKYPVSLLVEEDSKSSKWKKVVNNELNEHANLISSFDIKRGASRELDNWLSLGETKGSKQNIILSLPLMAKFYIDDNELKKDRYAQGGQWKK